MTGAFAVVAVMVASLAAGGCHDEARILLTLHGDIAGARSVEVILANPDVKLRAQRSGLVVAGAAVKEPVYYTAQRVLLDPYELDESDAVDGFKLQIAFDQQKSFLPIVVVRDIDTRIIGVGVYQPSKLFDTEPFAGSIVHKAGVVQVFHIDVEPVVLDAGTTAGELRPMSTRTVLCGDLASGLVWRTASGKQLRVLYPEPGGESADKRLDAPDLDCDQHTAGIVGVDLGLGDDRLDCDDLQGSVYVKAAEVCNGVDDNCDETDGGYEISATCDGCGTGLPGVCDDAYPANPSGESCMVPPQSLQCRSCTIDYNGGGSMASVTLCEASYLQSVFECLDGCDATVIDASSGLEVRIGPDLANLVDTGSTVRIVANRANGALLYFKPRSSMTFEAPVAAVGYFTIRFVPITAGALPFAMTFKLALGDISTCDPSAPHIHCTP